MFTQVRSALTYANVMATIAVFIALGGGAYAAVKLPKNSVGGAQIKKNAVTSTKVKNGSLKKGDFAKNQLPTGAPGPVGPAGARGPTGATGETGPTGTFGSVTTVFFQATSDLANATNASYGAFCGAGKVAIAGGGRGRRHPFRGDHPHQHASRDQCGQHRAAPGRSGIRTGGASRW